MVVLVVDDDPVSRLVCEHILRTGGYDVVTSESAEQANDLLGQPESNVTMIVCDYHMPGANGLDLLEHITSTTNHDARPPFVLLTGIGDADELDDHRTNDVSGYLTKPVQSGELLEMVAGLATTDG